MEIKEKKKVGEKRKRADESKLLRTVFVGNLPLKVKKKLILKEFKELAEASLAHNMSLIAGNHIRVMWIDHLYDSKRTVFMGNLPFDVKGEEVYPLFTGKSNLENNVEAVRVIRDPHLNIGKGIAYVLFETRIHF
uniref:RRM domain-containing protein n=1 Tax=Brassica oleracea var. oleracea TaxID=109376 RepID=A0A0D3AUQ9_BRAOL